MRDAEAMGVQEWWPKLAATTREWLIAHNGEPLPSHVIADIAWAGATVNAEQWWVEKRAGTKFFLSDAATDWVEAIANNERPEPEPDPLPAG